MRSDVVGVKRLLGVVDPAAVDHELELVVSRILKAVESFLEKSAITFYLCKIQSNLYTMTPSDPKK